MSGEFQAQYNEHEATEAMGSAIRSFVRRTEGLKLQLLLNGVNTVRGMEEDSGSGQRWTVGGIRLNTERDNGCPHKHK